MKKYTLIVLGINDMPVDIQMDVRPCIGDFITKDNVTSIVEKVAFNFDSGINYIVANFHTSNR